MGKEKITRGNSSQFFVAGELCRRGYTAVVTLGNTPNTDVLCSNTEGTKFVHIQVKTFRPGDRSCAVGKKAERIYSPNFFWILAGIPEVGSDSQFIYYIIPCSVMADNISQIHRTWLNSPGMDGQQHIDNAFRSILLPPKVNLNGWNITEYEGKWNFIDKLLQ